MFYRHKFLLCTRRFISFQRCNHSASCPLRPLLPYCPPVPSAHTPQRRLPSGLRRAPPSAMMTTSRIPQASPPRPLPNAIRAHPVRIHPQCRRYATTRVTHDHYMSYIPTIYRARIGSAPSIACQLPMSSNRSTLPQRHALPHGRRRRCLVPLIIDGWGCAAHPRPTQSRFQRGKSLVCLLCTALTFLRHTPSDVRREHLRPPAGRGKVSQRHGHACGQYPRRRRWCQGDDAMTDGQARTRGGVNTCLAGRTSVCLFFS